MNEKVIDDNMIFRKSILTRLVDDMNPFSYYDNVILLCLVVHDNVIFLLFFKK